MSGTRLGQEVPYSESEVRRYIPDFIVCSSGQEDPLHLIVELRDTGARMPGEESTRRPLGPGSQHMTTVGVR